MKVISAVIMALSMAVSANAATVNGVNVPASVKQKRN